MINGANGGVTFGSDPEFFFQNEKGKIIGSEHVLEKAGKEIVSSKFGSASIQPFGTFSAFVLDGVQVEMNTNAHSCRQSMGIEIAYAFRALRDHLQKEKGGKITACFSNTVEVGKKEFDALSDKSKEFGCAPSFNLYNGEAKIGVDPSIYRKRSAGGHIHLGMKNGGELYKNRERLIPLLDCLVGLTSVLVDRDPGNKERRKVYGRAGEYRLPNHGLEYRTLSNFWLRSYPLMGMVLGLCRLASYTLADSLENRGDPEKELLDSMDMEKVILAINENNYSLARKLWKGVEKFIEKNVPVYTSGYLSAPLLPQFNHFVDMIDKKGIEHWFPEDPIAYWSHVADEARIGQGHGFESLLHNGAVNDSYQKLRVGG